MHLSPLNFQMLFHTRDIQQFGQVLALLKRKFSSADQNQSRTHSFKLFWCTEQWVDARGIPRFLIQPSIYECWHSEVGTYKVICFDKGVATLE